MSTFTNNSNKEYKGPDYKNLTLAGNKYETVEDFCQAVARSRVHREAKFIAQVAKSLKLKAQDLANTYGKIHYANAIEYAKSHTAKDTSLADSIDFS